MRRVIVCGGRKFGVARLVGQDQADKDRRLMDVALSEFTLQDDLIVQGGAAGADLMAAEWAQRHGRQYQTFTARWDELGAFAGHERNRRMLDAGAQLVIAFPGGKGTANMVQIAREADVVVIECA